MVAENGHLVLGQLHGGVLVSAVELHDPGLGLVGHQDDVALGGAVFVHHSGQSGHRLLGGGGGGGGQSGEKGLPQAAFNSGVGGLPRIAARGGHGARNGDSHLIDADGGVEPVAGGGVILHLRIFIRVGGQGIGEAVDVVQGASRLVGGGDYGVKLIVI